MDACWGVTSDVLWRLGWITLSHRAGGNRMMWNSVLARLRERVSVIGWPWRWMEAESAQLAESQRRLQRFFYFVCVPAQCAFALIVIALKRVAFSPASLDLRMILGVSAIALVFLLLPVFGFARHMLRVRRYARGADGRISRRLQVFLAVTPVVLVIAVLLAAGMIGAVVWISVAR